MTDILIVDDNADIRRLLMVSLHKEFDVQEAPDGVTGLQMIRKFHPKMVLLDIMMPGELNGLQVLSEIRGNANICNTVVMVITALGQESHVENAKKHGADAYLVKPFSTLEVQDWVRSQMALS
jgi:DNA-binding response OmpR family regulator